MTRVRLALTRVHFINLIINHGTIMGEHVTVAQADRLYGGVVELELFKLDDCRVHSNHVTDAADSEELVDNVKLDLS